MDDLGEIVGEFLVECHENLNQLDHDLIALEQQPQSRELISRIFRAVHTIKGTSGFLAFARMEAVTHTGESLLARLRDGVQPVTPTAVAALRAMIDGVRELLAGIERDGGEPDLDVAGLIGVLHTAVLDEQVNVPIEETTIQIADRAVTEAAGTQRRDPADSGLPDLAATVPADAAGTPPPDPAEAGPADRTMLELAVRRPPEPVEQQRRPLGEMLVEQGAASSADVASALQRQLDGDHRRLGTILLDEGKTVPAAVTEALAAQAPRRTGAEGAVRVEPELLDDLLNLVGELALARNQLVRGVLQSGDPALVRAAHRVGSITGELQEAIMKTRMQPIDRLFAKLPRLVRDLGNSMGKQVRLVLQGRETELDRTLLDAIKDPLVHLVRNAIDHGIEDPQVRTAAGKSAQGTLTLRAFHEARHATIEVADDGAGLDVDRIAQTAIENGLIQPEQLDGMDRRDILALVLRPGFSTAGKVTKMSGRGVGMDVVKTNIERIGGTVDVDSTPGHGTVCRLTIPLTRAIIQVLTVDCADQRYVLPQASVQELVYIDGAATRIEYTFGVPVYRLRGIELPLVRLDRALGMDVGADQGVYIVVLNADNRRFGLVVDRVRNTEEVVVKALSAPFADVGLYAGATILGDGKVGLILDVTSLLRNLEPTVQRPDREAGRTLARPDGTTGSGQRTLIAAVGPRRVAIPLDALTRLEELPRDRITPTGSGEAVRYDGRTLPLSRLSVLLGEPAAEPGDPAAVVVYTGEGRTVALLVDRVIDIVEDAASAPPDPADPAPVGTAMIQQRLGELLDARRAILAADPNVYRDQPGHLMVGT